MNFMIVNGLNVMIGFVWISISSYFQLFKKNKFGMNFFWTTNLYVCKYICFTSFHASCALYCRLGAVGNIITRLTTCNDKFKLNKNGVNATIDWSQWIDPKTNRSCALSTHFPFIERQTAKWFLHSPHCPLPWREMILCQLDRERFHWAPLPGEINAHCT